MTAIQDFVATINKWSNYADDEALVTSWVRMAEERINVDLRISDMIQIDTGVLVQDRVLLPLDWLELDFVRKLDGGPLRYMPREEFFAAFPSDDVRYKTTCGHYTLLGNYIVVGGDIDEINGTTIELSYYGDVPQLAANPTWLSTRYTRLLTSATLSAMSSYHLEDQRAVGFESVVAELIAAYNQKHQIAKVSGSTLRIKPNKGYG